MDDVDARIIEILSAQGRAAYGDVGVAVGLSPSAVKRRVDRLVRAGVITGFTIAVDPYRSGARPTEAYVEVFCRGTVSPEELARIVEHVPEVVHAGTVSGAADAVLHMIAADIGALEAAIEKVREAPHVDHTESAIVLTPLVRSSTCGPGPRPTSAGARADV